MITDLLSSWIHLLTRLVATLFVLRFLQGLHGARGLGFLLKPFRPWMDPLVDWAHGRMPPTPGKPDFAPLVCAFFVLLVGTLFALLF